MYSKKEKQSKCITRLVALLSPLRKRGIANIEGRGVREREKITVSHLFMMRAGQSALISSRQFQCSSESDPVSPSGRRPHIVHADGSVPPLESVGNPTANENSPFQIGLESSRNLGLYKPTAPDPNQDTWAYNFAANSSEVGPPSPTRNFAAKQLGLRK